jgi:two-component system OmpR family response regulator
METNPHILVVDDHEEIRDLVARYLDQHGYRASVAADTAAMREILAGQAIDLVVLDVMMPGEDGLAACRDLRARSALPVIMLTALGEETDRIIGLEMGADDYLPKPFNPRELLARIKAVLRRAGGQGVAARTTGAEPGRNTASFGTWFLDLDRRELRTRAGVTLPLSKGEFSLLQAFVARPHKVLSRDQLLDLAKGNSAEVFDRSIDTQVSRLRRKIEPDPTNPIFIRTIWGDGYMFVPDAAAP